MTRARVAIGRMVALLVLGVLACDPRARRSADQAPSASAEAPRASSSALDELDPCSELGVIVPRRSVELLAPRSGKLEGGGPERRGEGELVFAIVAGDDLASVEVHAAELDEAEATRERQAAEQHARARELAGAEQLGDHLADTEREAARDAHTIATRELHRSDAAREAAAARLEAQRARIRAGLLDAPFAGRLVEQRAIVGTWVQASQLLGRFASTEDLVLRVALPAESNLHAPIEVRWHWPEQPDTRFAATLRPTRDEVDELSGLRLYEARVTPSELGEHPLGAALRVELPHCLDGSVDGSLDGTPQEPTHEPR